ncbi:MAG: hypothetical protein M3Z17_02180 [Gemmatimonadota bacterium]|nr:hypothetical protein [Gemmatimonadota bacterium]
MNRFVRIAAVLACIAPSIAAAQSGLTYDFTLTEKIDGQRQTSTGHAFVTPTSVRMDFFGKSSLGKIGMTDLGDSISIIQADTGAAKLLTLINHRDKQFVQFSPTAMMEKMKDAMKSMPGMPSMDFTGSTVTVDSLGPGGEIAGYNTLLYRLNATIRISVGGQPVGEQDLLGDYYVAPDLKDFAVGSTILAAATDQTGSVPGLPRAFADQLAAAGKRVGSAMALKISLDARSSMMGTGSMRTQTLEMSNIHKVDVPTTAFVAPAGYKKIVPKGMEKLM